MSDAVADTHGLIWYFRGDLRLGAMARQWYQNADQGTITIYVPTICLVEIIYLEEKGRVPPGIAALFRAKIETGAIGMKLEPLTADIATALARIPRALVPDMPDRIIAATALHLGLPVISKDSKIQLSALTTIW